MVQQHERSENGKHVYPTSKTYSAELQQQQQQQQQRKAGRSNHVQQDVAKQPSGPGFKGNGGHQSASHGVASGRVESERSSQANSVAPANTGQNGQQARPTANGSNKPEQGAYGRPAPVRPQPVVSRSQPNANRPVSNGPAYGPGGNEYRANGPRPIAVASCAHAPAVPAPPAGSRSRDTGGPANANPGNGATADGNSGDAGRSGRDPRRRGVRGREVAGAAEPIGAEGAVQGAPGAGGAERQERSGRPRGGRRPRSSAGGAPDGDVAVAGGGEALVTPETGPGGADRETPRGGRPRGRRGRGTQQSCVAEGAEQGDAAEHVGGTTRPQAQQAAAVDGSEERPRQQRQRPPRDAGANGQQSRQAAGDQGAGLQSTTGREQKVPVQAATPDGQQQSVGPKQQRQRKGREPRPPMPQANGPRHLLDGESAAEQNGVEPARGGGGRGQGRSGGRKNGPDGARSADNCNEVAAGNGENPGSVPGGQRQRAARPPRQQQQQSNGLQQQPSPVDQLASGQWASESPPAVAAAAPVPVAQAPAEREQQQAPLAPSNLPIAPPPPPHMQQHQLQQVPMQQHQQPFPPLPPPPPPFQEGAPHMVDFQHSMLQHMLPHQHPFGLPQDFQQAQQQHQFMQHLHHQPPPPPPPPQFDQAFHEHFRQQQHQHFMQQHMVQQQHQQQHLQHQHGFLGAGFDPQNGSVPPPGHMPAFFAGANPFGQMLPPPPAFAGASSPPISQAAVGPASGAHAPEYMLAQELGRPEERQYQQHEVQPYMPEPSPAVPVVSQVVAEQVQAHQPPEAPAAPAQVEVAVVTAVAQPDTVPVAAHELTGDAPAAEPVKNEWADRLAQQALARMNAVKSSLISGGSSALDGPGGSGAVDDRPRSSSQQGRPSQYSAPPQYASPRGPPVANGNEPETWIANGDAEVGSGRRSGSSALAPSEAWRNGAGNGAAAVDAASGWRASLAPTGAADAAEAWRLRDEAAKAPAPYLPPRREESPPPPLSSSSSTAAGGRPRLNLQPRTKPLPQPAAPAGAGSTAMAAAKSSDAPSTVNVTGGGGASAAANSNGARPSIFGAARPREEVLRERGVAEPERLTSSHVAHTNGTVAGTGAGAGIARSVGNRAGSVTSGASDEDQWHTVGKGGRSKPPPAGVDVGNALLDAASDPFFTGRTTAGHGVAIVGRSIPTGRMFGGAGGSYGNGGGSYGKGSHGNGSDTYMNAYGASRGYGNSYGNEDDEPIFKRGLPTRSDGIF